MMIVAISILFLTVSNMAPLNMVFVADFWWIPFIRVREYYSALLWMGVVSFWPRDWTWVSRIVGRFFTVWATREALVNFIKCEISPPMSLIIIMAFTVLNHPCIPGINTPWWCELFSSSYSTGFHLLIFYLEFLLSIAMNKICLRFFLSYSLSVWFHYQSDMSLIK